MTVWLSEYAKKQMSKHSRMCSSYQMDVGSECFKRVFGTYRNAVNTAVKRTSKMNDCDGREGRNIKVRSRNEFDAEPQQQLLHEYGN